LLHRQGSFTVVKKDIALSKNQMVVVSSLGVECQQSSNSVDISAHGFVDVMIVLGNVMEWGMYMEEYAEVQATKCRHLTLEANVFGIVLDVTLKKFYAAYMLLVAGHIRSGLTSAVDADDMYLVDVSFVMPHGLHATCGRNDDVVVSNLL
jgi:hypothetical protein